MKRKVFFVLAIGISLFQNAFVNIADGLYLFIR